MWTDAPYFGAIPDKDGTRFRVMAGTAESGDLPRLELILHTGERRGAYEVTPARTGVFEIHVPDARPGDQYSYRLNGSDLRPDPASRFQPLGIHGPSEVIDAARFNWRDAGWTGRLARERVVYELHVGTFTPEGTFDAARRCLPRLRELGISLIELMPLADFPGERNWGYDGVCLFAPARAYGRPDDLRALVDAAHDLGLGVMLDVVYNHLGPEGAHLRAFNPHYLTSQHSTPWGDAVNLDGPGSEVVRMFIIDNALHWIREYHLDGLRFDATHALIDDSPVHVVAELAERLRSAVPRPLVLHAEDDRNLSAIVEPREAGGWGLDGVWADDFHHTIRRLVAGDSHGYYQDYSGTTEELAQTIQQGWLYTGQRSKHMNRTRGTDASRVPMLCSVVCLQNHDQIGNRACGDRLHHGIDAASWRAASVLLLTSPTTPLLFMGQEWAASTPFLFFTDLGPELGRAVSEGRRQEFRDFPEFVACDDLERIPDPQALGTYEQSKLRWDERSSPPHALHLALYTELLRLRAAHPALQASECRTGQSWTAGEDAIVMRRSSDEETFLIVTRLRGSGEVNYETCASPAHHFEPVLTTEESRFSADPMPPTIRDAAIRFERAGAVVLRQDDAAG
ncbi:MAG: malto-oligosyltrehalose trehalohydrolase [Vicinamibacterales bacterium]